MKEIRVRITKSHDDTVEMSAFWRIQTINVANIQLITSVVLKSGRKINNTRTNKIL